MSLQRLSPLLSLTHTAGRTLLPGDGERQIERLLASLRGVAFWCAILLPLTYLPLLFGGGAPPSSFGGDLSVVLLLIALNVVAFALGHDHNRPTEA